MKKDTKDLKSAIEMLKESDGYLLITDTGMICEMKPAEILSGVTTLLQAMKTKGVIGDTEIETLCKLAKIQHDMNGVITLMKMMKDKLEKAVEKEKKGNDEK